MSTQPAALSDVARVRRAVEELIGRQALESSEAQGRLVIVDSANLSAGAVAQVGINQQVFASVVAGDWLDSYLAKIEAKKRATLERIGPVEDAVTLKANRSQL